MSNNKIRITIYRYTGNQGLFSIPKDWCEECDLLIALVKDTVKELRLENRVEIKIRPWFLWAWLPFIRYFAWHPPFLIIDGKLISQGIVPEKKQIMVKMLTKDDGGLSQCKECGFIYADKEWAEKCEAWCKEHKSCNLEITSHGYPS